MSAVELPPFMVRAAEAAEEEERRQREMLVASFLNPIILGAPGNRVILARRRELLVAGVILGERAARSAGAAAPVPADPSPAPSAPRPRAGRRRRRRR